jgi:hypothetical protein
MKKLLVALAATSALLCAVSGASATTVISISANPVTPNLDGLIISGGLVSLGSSNNAPQSTGANPSDPFGWDPWGSADNNSQWLSVGGCCGGSGSFQTLNISSPVNTLTLLWGSPNSDNTITLSNGDTISYQDGSGYYVDGVQKTSAYPNTTDPGYIVTITSSVPFQSATLTNDIGGFEVADISVSATPLPSTWMMLLAGFVGLGFFAYRGTKNSAAALTAA